MSAGSSSTSSKADPSDQNAVRQQQAFVGDAELELERFRREWQQEVAQRKPPENRSEREHQHQRQRSAGSANGAKPSSSALPSAGAEPKDDSTDGGRAPASPSRTKWRDPQEATEGAAGSAGVGEGEDQEDGATSHNGPSSSSSPSSSKWGSLIASSALPFQTTTTSRRAAPGSTNTQRFSAAAPALANEGTQIQMKGAVEAYAHAVEMERAGRLDEALTSYRKAFRLDSHADGLYQRAQALLSDPFASDSPQQTDALLSSPAIAQKVRAATDYEPLPHPRKNRAAAAADSARSTASAAAQGLPNGSAQYRASQTQLDKADYVPSSTSQVDELSRLLGDLAIQRDVATVRFEPEDEEREVLIARLPDEIVLLVLGFLAAPRGRRGTKITRTKVENTGAHAHNDGSAAVPSANAEKESQSLSQPPSHSQTQSQSQTQAQNQNPEDHTTAAAGGAPEPEPAAAGRARNRVVGVGMVLGGPDFMSLESVARVCWKFRMLSVDGGLWRTIVRETYFPPQISPSLPLTSLYEMHNRDWRNAFINQPRVRLNGAYIAACHYARPGMSEENVWVRVVHVVEFYRSLRFLPDGRCLSLLTTDSPSETVRKMEPSLRSKGFSTGRWSLHADGLPDDDWCGRKSGPKVLVEDLRDKTMEKYSFRMVFGLRQTGRGRWNKLDLIEYWSVHLGSGEVLPLPQKHSRPFHFSAVRSYGI